MSTNTITALPLTPPTSRRIRAYFAPVDRNQSRPTIFDPSQSGNFNLDSPPTPWLDLGWVDTFERKSNSKVVPLRSGAPEFAMSQVRTEIDALVTVGFLSWGKLQMAVTAGSEQMNLLQSVPEAAANGSGGKASTAVSVQSGSTASLLVVGSSQVGLFSTGQMISVDVDYSGQVGYVGSGISGAFINSASTVQPDVDYIRRISFNVGRITAVTSTGLGLAQPLIAGTPTEGMSVQRILGFADREGSNFFQEWSALFVIPGEQNDRIYLHYPRLQIAANASESMKPVGIPANMHLSLNRAAQIAQFRGLPVVDLNDGAQVVCFRSYLPADSTALW